MRNHWLQKRKRRLDLLNQMVWFRLMSLDNAKAMLGIKK